MRPDPNGRRACARGAALGLALVWLAACTEPPIFMAAAPPPPTPAAAGPERRAIPPSGRHVVAPGETLSEIAWMYRLGTERLAALNAIGDADRIHVGQRLRLRPDPSIPPPERDPAADDEPLRVVIHAQPEAVEEEGEAEPEAPAIDPRMILP